MWRAHRVLVVASTVALVAVALWSATGGGLKTLAGSYALPDFGDLGGVADKELAWLARVVAGTGYVTAVFALPWLAKGLVRRQAFSVVAVLAAGALLVSLADAAPDERYVMGLAPLLAIAAVAAVARREVRLAGTLVALVACVALVLSERWDLHLGAFAFFAFPAESLHRELVLGRLSVPPLSWLPGGTDLALALLMAAAVAIALVALRRRGAAAVIVALLVVAQLGAGAYALRKFDEQVGAPTPLSLSRRAFVDRHARGAEWAAVWDIGVGELPESIGQYRDAQFWNTRLRGDVTENGIVKAAYQYQLARHTQLAVDPSTGAARSAQGPTPPLLLVPRGFNALALVWRTRDRPYLPFDLVEPRRPLQAAWRVTHAELDGRVRAGQRARVRIFRAAGAAHACGLLAVQAPPGGGDAWPYRARIAGRTSAGRVAEAEPRVVAIPVSPRRPHTDAVVWSPRRDLLLAGMSIGPCP
jgi:hypothetical protein